MGFTLTDPRLQAISQAGGNFGTGLGDALTQYIANRQFNTALKNINPQSSVNDILQQFAQNNVSPEMQERYFSPVVQQRLQAQNAANYLTQALQNARSPQEIANAVIQAKAMTGNLQDVDKMVDLAMRGIMPMPGTLPQGLGGQTRGPSNQTPPFSQAVPPGKQGATKPIQPSTTSQNTAFPNIQNVGVGGESVIQDIPASTQVRPYTEAEKNEIRAKGRIWGPQGDAAAEKQIQDRNEEYAFQKDQLALAERAQEKQKKAQDEINDAVDKGMARDYVDNPQYRTDFEELAKYYARNETTGSPEQRYNKVRNKYLTPIIDDLQRFKDKIPHADRLASFNDSNKQKILKNLNVDAKNYLAKFPEDYKNIGYETLRTELKKQRGIGPVSAEYAIQYPDENLIKEFKAISPFPPIANMNMQDYQKFSIGQRVPFDKTTQMFVDNAEKRLDKILRREIPKGTSPIILKDLFVDGLGYPDFIFDDLLKQYMNEDDFEIPSYNQTALRDVNKKFGQHHPLDTFGGQTLLGPLEFFK